MWFLACSVFLILKNDKIKQLPLEKDKSNFQESVSLAYSHTENI